MNCATGKLSITVHDCQLLRSPFFNAPSVRVQVVVDGTRRFFTGLKKNTFNPVFNEKFTVDNTHRLAIVELLLYNRSFVDTAEHEWLVGTCRLSIERLEQGIKRLRHCFFAASDGSGLVGTINVSFRTYIPGDVKPIMDVVAEKNCLHRLLRFLLRYDKALLGDIDLLLALVKTGQKSAGSDAFFFRTNDTTKAEREGLFLRGSYESFEVLMNDMCEHYGCTEQSRYRLTVTVEGCTYVESSHSFTPSYLTVVICGQIQDFMTPTRPFSTNSTWCGEDAVAQIDVFDPETFVLNIKVCCASTTSELSEIGHGQVRLITLSRGYTSRRQVFVFSDEGRITPCIKAMVHLKFKPLNFGAVPSDFGGHVDKIYERLNCFFYRYDHMRIRYIDALISSRLDNLDELMSELETEYGREPGTVELLLIIKELHSIRSDSVTDLDGEEVVVVVTMGDVVARTRSRSVAKNFKTLFGEAFSFDVARETDMIKLEVVNAGNEEIIYGRTDLLCLRLEKGAFNNRTVYLVGSAGTSDAYLSGMLDIVLQSDHLGQPYSVDNEALNIYAGRLRHCVHTHAPDKLHLVDVAVGTVFDTESFMKGITKKYGKLDDTHVLYLTVLGCRQLSGRFGFSRNAYVVVRLGIRRCETRVVKASTEPDFFEFFEFLLDQPKEKHLTIIVMDRNGLRVDKELGRAVISLENLKPGFQFHDWLQLHKDGEKKRNVEEIRGFVGIKFVIKDVDECITQHSIVNQNLLCSMKENKHGNTDKGLSSRKLLATFQRIGGRHGPFLSFFGGWGNKLARMTHQLQFHSCPPGGSGSATPSGDVSNDLSVDHDNFRMSLNVLDEVVLSAFDFSSQPALENEHLDCLRPSVIAEETDPDVYPESFFASAPSQEMRLRVLLLSCEDLDNRILFPPSPYVRLSTLKKTHYTKVAFHTRSPRYNEIFAFSVSEPHNDYLNITVITDTPYGKKCLGSCVLSMKNIQRGVPQTRRVSLVSAPHRATAAERGTVQLTLLAENFGLHHMPSTTVESRFGDVLQRVLVKKFPKELHRLQWYIGEYYLRENELVERAVSRYDAETIGVEAAKLTLVVRQVTDLLINDQLVDFGACFVKVKIDKKECCRTRAISGAKGFFNMEQTCHLTVPEPTTKTVRLTIHVERNRLVKCGECVFSLADLKQNTLRERTHFIVKDAGLKFATPVGFITLSLISNNFGSVLSSLDVCDESQYERMRDYYYYYLPEQLHEVDVKYSRTFNVDAYIKRLVERYGPEPGKYNFKISVFYNMLSLTGRNDEDSDDDVCTLCSILRVGFRQFRGFVDNNAKDSTISETFHVQIGLPEKEKVFLILLSNNKGSCIETELMRTEICLQGIVCGVESWFNFQLPQNKWWSKGILYCGDVNLSVFSEDFGSTILSEHQ